MLIFGAVFVVTHSKVSETNAVVQLDNRSGG